jgi:hypothetical protein
MPQLAASPLALVVPCETYVESLAETLSTSYAIPGDPSLDEFLVRHLEAEPHLRRCFGGSRLALRLASDDYGWETLFVDILWPGKARDAVEALDRFEDSWWIENSSAAAGCLTFTYRLI